MDNQQLIVQLKDLHLPSPPGLWPLAFGWYLLLFISLFVIVMMFYWSSRRWINNRAQRCAIKELDKLRQAYNQDPDIKYIEKLSILLKRVALAYFPRKEIAGLSGKKWLKFLNQTGNTMMFTSDIGKLLVTAPYKKTVEEDISVLISMCAIWIGQRK